MAIPSKTYTDAADDLKINIADIVDDLTTGGRDVPSSAETVKTLAGMISSAVSPTHERGTVYNALTPQGDTWGIAQTTDIAVTNGGAGYEDRDAVFIPSSTAGDIEAIIIVETVDAGGAILTVSLSKEGDYTTDESGANDALGGSGTGAVFTVTMTDKPASTLADIVNPQPNDMATVAHDELHAGSAYRWGMMDYNGDGVYNWVPVTAFPAGTGAGRDFTAVPIEANELGTGAVTPAKLDDSAKALFVARTAAYTANAVQADDASAMAYSLANTTTLTLFPEG
ncbi:hypothetical protein FACS1894216_01390 [Synergistales bacterium]|nr:hypothetical protein FACS1894216_01390 [Synergistales bacterium]